MGGTQDNKIPINIPEFYKGKSVFVTGFTGYLGKALVEKLLYSCPDVNKIYVLVRNKKGQTPQERVKTVVETAVFDRVRKLYPGAIESKIVPVAGDIAEEDFALSKEDRELLIRDVSVILHAAASVRFDDPLKLALKLNTFSAKTMVDLALKMPKLTVLVYISTAYTNCDHLFIKEDVYPPKADWRITKEISESIDETTLNILTAKFINHMPNTYVFTKSLSEQVFNEYRDRLPISIVRPSIVVPALKEPIPGWTDNKYGPWGMVLGFVLGIIRCSHVDKAQKCNYIYSDVVINATIIASWKTAMKHNPKIIPDSVTVYNACTPLELNMDHEEFAEMYAKGDCVKLMIKDGVHFISVMFIKNDLWYRINVFVRHLLPAAFIDMIIRLSNKKPLMVAVRRKIFIALAALSYFTTRTFIFEDDNFNNLINDLRPEDKEAFSWNWNKEVHAEYYATVYLEAKNFLLKPLFDDLEGNRKKLLMLYYVDNASVYLTYSLLAYLTYALSIPQALYSLLTAAIYF